MHSWIPGAVTREMTVRLVVPGKDGAVALAVVLSYDESDPYAVRATFRTGRGDGVEWVFARDLLALGVRRACGDGDVRIWPAAAERGRDGDVFIALSSPDGEALLQATASDLVEFLARSYQVVPAGREEEHLDVDTAIEQLLTT